MHGARRTGPATGVDTAYGASKAALLALCRFGQGFGLGGEWGGAVLLATENAPPGKQTWYGMFPQLGAPLGFILANSVFIVLDSALTDEAFTAWGWRVPFLAGFVLIGGALWVRLRVEESLVFKEVQRRRTVVKLPLAEAEE